MNKPLTISVIFFILSGMNSIAIPEAEDNNHFIQTITFEKPTLSEFEESQILNINNIETIIREPGKPLISSYEKIYTFPFGTKINDISIEIQDSQFMSIDQDIRYAPLPVSSQYQILSEDNIVEIESTVYPEEWFDYRVGLGIEGQERKVFVTLSIYPIRYHSYKDQVEYIDEITMDISYESQNVNTLLNNDRYELLILSPPEFFVELIPLVDHKIYTQNLSTKLVTTTDIYDEIYFEVEGRDNPEKIKYFIKNAIESWDTNYVMFVGGAEQFPTRETHVFVDYHDGDDEIFVSDLYYADIYDAEGKFCSWDSNENDVFGEFDWDDNYDDVDLYPDVHFGRLAATSSDVVESVVNKIITYESEEAWTQDWFNTMVVIGGDTFPGDEKGINEGEYMNQASLDYMDGFIPDKIWDSNWRLSGFSPTGFENINSAIENGCGFLDWAGHGGTGVWTTYPHNGSRQSLPTPLGAYRSNNVLDLKNEGKLPIVITGACSVGKFNTNPKCFTWSFVKNPDGGGIGAVGPSGLAWGYTGTWVTHGLSGKLHMGYYKAFAEGAYTFGEMHTGALIDYISSSMDGGDHKTIQQFMAFGDPSLMVRDESSPPEKPILNGPPSGKIREKITYTATTTDPDDDKISFIFDWGDGTYSEWVGFVDSGDEVQATHTWEKRGDYNIRVLARNDRGVRSSWSDPLPVTMPYQRKPSYNPLIERIIENYPFLGSFFDNMSCLKNLND
jgi:hypothetical protein